MTDTKMINKSEVLNAIDKEATSLINKSKNGDCRLTFSQICTLRDAFISAIEKVPGHEERLLESGRWERYESTVLSPDRTIIKKPNWRCSKCKQPVPDYYNTRFNVPPIIKHCPNCGAFQQEKLDD